MSKKIKIGIVGYGNISKKHIAARNKNKKFEVVSRCDSKNLKIKYKKYKFFNDMLKTEKDIDLVTILSPSGYHYDQIIKSLKYRKHVIVEKPFTTSYRDALFIKNIADKKKLKVVDQILSGTQAKIKKWHYILNLILSVYQVIMLVQQSQRKFHKIKAFTFLHFYS